MKIRRGTAFLCAGAMILSMVPSTISLQAYDFSDEAAWVAKCSGVQESSQDSAACNAFKEYYQQQQSDLQEQIDAFQNDINDLQDSLDDLESLVAQQQTPRSNPTLRSWKRISPPKRKRSLSGMRRSRSAWSVSRRRSERTCTST